MTRRDDNFLSNLFHLLTATPFWVGPVLAAAAFAGLRWGIPAAFDTPKLEVSTASPEETVSFGGDVIGHAIAQASRWLAPWIALLVVGLWLAAEAKKWIDRRQDSQPDPKA